MNKLLLITSVIFLLPALSACTSKIEMSSNADQVATAFSKLSAWG